MDGSHDWQLCLPQRACGLALALAAHAALVAAIPGEPASSSRLPPEPRVGGLEISVATRGAQSAAGGTPGPAPVRSDPAAPLPSSALPDSDIDAKVASGAARAPEKSPDPTPAEAVAALPTQPPAGTDSARRKPVANAIADSRRDGPATTAHQASGRARQHPAVGGSTEPGNDETARGLPPVAGRGEPAARAEYAGLVRSWLARHKDYPRPARMRRHTGETLLYLRIDTSGEVLEARVQESSGFETLDRATLVMVERARPLPHPDPQVGRDALEMLIPVHYSLH